MLSLGTTLFKREKKVADLALKYLDTATSCVSEGEKATLAYLNGDRGEVATAWKKSAEFESTADLARRNIGDLLFSGAYLPLVRGDIFSLIESLDKVPNAAESCCRFFLGENPMVPEDLRPAFVEVTAESFGAMRGLRRAMEALFNPNGNPEHIRAHACDVSDLESRVDAMEWDLTMAIFENECLDLSQKRHLKAALDRIAHLSDAAENVADRLNLAAMKSVI